jgi:hypothetical protein
MKQIRAYLVLTAFIVGGMASGQRTMSVAAEAQKPAAPRVIDLKASDGTILKASYFAAAKPGPGVLLFHQSNRDRKSWDDVAGQLAAAGINALTVDSRGHGESGDSGKYDEQSWGLDLDVAFQCLLSQPGVNHEVIGIGGAGWLGVLNSVETARRHSAEVKSLVLLSGETLRPLLDSHVAPASSWSDTEQRRAEIRHDAQEVLKKLNAAH